MLSTDEAIEVLESGNRAIRELLELIDADELVRPRTMGGGAWSVKDLLGHIAFWEELALDTIDDWRRHERPGVMAIFERGPAGTDEANAENQARTVKESPSEVHARLENAHRALVGSIGAMLDSEWSAATFFEDPEHHNLGELLGSVVGAPNKPFGHVDAHLDELRAYVL